MIRISLILFLISSFGLSYAEEDPFAQIFAQHVRLMKELSKHLVAQDQSAPPPIPRQKNYSSTGSTSAASVKESSVPATPIERRFSAKTIWANITVVITDNHTNFKVVVQSDTPVQGWLIKRGSNKQVIAKGGTNEAQTFSFEINEPYDPDLELTCMINKDGFTNPALVPLR